MQQTARAANDNPNIDDTHEQQAPPYGLEFMFWAIVERAEDTIRARPLPAVGAATLAGFVAGSLTPRLIARPLGVLALRELLGRVRSPASL